MNLYLVRHGEAMHESDDAARPLSERGREEVDKLAAYLAGLDVKVAEIRHSGKARAEQTARRLGAALAAPVSRMAGLAPDDDPTPIAAEVSVATDDLMLVGHLPHLGRLASVLLVGDDARSPIPLRTGGLVRLQRDGGVWRLLWALSPGALR